MNKINISVVISAYNEEKMIKDCLESVKWADEIILVNNSSTDRTAAIAAKYTTKIYQQPNNLMLNVNKNFGFSKATNDWILSLDADERVTPELRGEINSQLSTCNFDFQGFYLPRKNIIFGKWIKYTGWYPDHQLRLFKKAKGLFEEKHVHEMLRVDGNVSYLENPLIHHNYLSISQFLHKTINIYAPNEADEKINEGYVFKYTDCIRFPFNEFMKRYFAEKGYKDGFHGLMLSFLMAFYHLIVFAYIWEQNKFIDKNENSLKLFKKELKSTKKELKHWLCHEEIADENNKIKKFLIKLKNKIL